MAFKNDGFNDWVFGVNSLLKKAQDSLPKLLLVFGNSDYLLYKSLLAVKAHFKKYDDAQVVDINVKDLTQDSFVNTYNTRSLLDPLTLYVVDGCEKEKKFNSLVEFIATSSEISNHFCFLYAKETVDKKVQGVFDNKLSLSIPCVEPDFYQLMKYIDYILQENNVKMSADAKKMLIESFGNSLSLIENEIRKFSLMFCNLDREITVADIGSSVGVLREDFAFKLRSTIMDGQMSFSHILLKDLLRRGESPLAILGMLSKHCRNSIKVKELSNKGYRPADISKTIGLQMFLINGYIRYVSGINMNRLLDCLEACRQADVAFKTSKLSDELLLDTIVDSLHP